MSATETNQTAKGQTNPFGTPTPIPAILVSFTPPGACPQDRIPVYTSLSIGRSAQCEIAIKDDKISKRHCRIIRGVDTFSIEDLNSTNGTFVDGAAVAAKQPLPDNAVIRIGRTVLVFKQNGAALLNTAQKERFGMSGAFHITPLIDELADASKSDRHILLTGPSGTGKELAAAALAAMFGTETPLPLTIHNAARFASQEETAVTLFGVGARFFSGVDARPGLIETAGKGVLFLDEIHNLPESLQRSLLRIIEDGVLTRLGETKPRNAPVRFIFASNAPDRTCGLAHDLFARLRRVEISSLAERRADIPSMLGEMIPRALAENDLEPIPLYPLFSGDHFESLMLDGFPDDNIRGLTAIVDRIVSGMKRGAPASEVITRVFANRYSASPVAKRLTPAVGDGAPHYEQNRELIVAAYRTCKDNLSATERLLKSKGINCCRRVLALYLKRWDVR